MMMSLFTKDKITTSCVHQNSAQSRSTSDDSSESRGVQTRHSLGHKETEVRKYHCIHFLINSKNQHVGHVELVI